MASKVVRTITIDLLESDMIEGSEGRRSWPGFRVTEGDLAAAGLTWEEMLGQVAVMTNTIPPGEHRFGMTTADEDADHDRWHAEQMASLLAGQPDPDFEVKQ